MMEHNCDGSPLHLRVLTEVMYALQGNQLLYLRNCEIARAACERLWSACKTRHVCVSTGLPLRDAYAGTRLKDTTADAPLEERLADPRGCLCRALDGVMFNAEESIANLNLAVEWLGHTMTEISQETTDSTPIVGPRRSSPLADFRA